jgi:hypothetical protein
LLEKRFRQAQCGWHRAFPYSTPLSPNERIVRIPKKSPRMVPGLVEWTIAQE